METMSSTSSQPAAEESGHRLHGGALIAVIIALMLTLLLEALDQTVVGTALPKIIGSLQGFDRYTWAITAYTLASTTMIPVVGKLSDQFGRKWFLLVGTAIFLLGSALSGASQTMVMRETSVRFDSPTVSETMLMLRRRKSEATRVRTPGLSWTWATKVWSIKPQGVGNRV